jgi:WD40 repeat protein
MDVPTHQYDTLLRSHTGAITMIDTDPIRDQFVSTSEDGTIRVWDLNNFEQLFEFNAPGEKVTCAAYHPKRYEIAAGFDSGLIRVFDIASTSLIQVCCKAETLYVNASTPYVFRGFLVEQTPPLSCGFDVSSLNHILLTCSCLFDVHGKLAWSFLSFSYFLGIGAPATPRGGDASGALVRRRPHVFRLLRRLRLRVRHPAALPPRQVPLYLLPWRQGDR